MSTNSIAPTSLLIDPDNPSETLARCAGMARAMEQAAESYTDRAWEVAP